MKPFKKVAAFLLAAVIIALSAGCTPISLTKEWSYKYGDDELSIGVYIYSLYQAYNQAQTYAEKNEDYSSDKSFMDLQITDDDGNTEVAKTWILNEADKITKRILSIDNELKTNNITVDQATMDQAKSEAQNVWDMGAYASYGYFNPMSKVLEPYGISFDSFYVSSYGASAKENVLFNGIYGKDGTKEVSDSEIKDYFNENYTNYSFFPVNLYTSETDEEGNSTNTPLTDDEKKKVENELKGYVDDIKSGKSFEEIVNVYMEENEVTDNPSQSNTEILENSSIGDEIKEKLKEMKEGTAETLQVGDGDTAVLYLIYKGDISKEADTYLSDETNRSNVLSNMKQDEFNDYIDEKANNLEIEKNQSQIDKYSPDMFFVPVEPTTEAQNESDAK